MNVKYAPVAQLDRVSDSDSEGRAFESHQAYQIHILRPSPWGMSKRNRGIAQQVEQRSPKPRVPSSILGAPAKEKVLSDSDKTFFISLQKESTALIAKIVSQLSGFVFRKFTKWEQLKTELPLPKVFSVWTCKKSWVFRMVALASSLNKNQSGQFILSTDNGKRKRRTKKYKRARFRQTEERDYSGKSTSSNTVLLI